MFIIEFSFELNLILHRHQVMLFVLTLAKRFTTESTVQRICLRLFVYDRNSVRKAVTPFKAANSSQNNYCHWQVFQSRSSAEKENISSEKCVA